MSRKLGGSLQHAFYLHGRGGLNRKQAQSRWLSPRGCSSTFSVTASRTGQLGGWLASALRSTPSAEPGIPRDIPELYVGCLSIFRSSGCKQKKGRCRRPRRWRRRSCGRRVSLHPPLFQRWAPCAPGGPTFQEAGSSCCSPWCGPRPRWPVTGPVVRETSPRLDARGPASDRSSFDILVVTVTLHVM